MSTDVQESNAIIIESNNCTAQYKSASPFFKLQHLSDVVYKPVIRIWSIAGHGKGEVDHVGGIAKVIIRQDIASCMSFTDTEDIVCHLSSKYAERQDLKYVVKNINMERLITAQSENKQFKYNTI